MKAEVGHSARVDARKPLNLVREAARLVARLEQLAPARMELLVVLAQGLAVALARGGAALEKLAPVVRQRLALRLHAPLEALQQVVVRVRLLALLIELHQRLVLFVQHLNLALKLGDDQARAPAELLL